MIYFITGIILAVIVTLTYLVVEKFHIKPICRNECFDCDKCRGHQYMYGIPTVFCEKVCKCKNKA